MNLELVKAVLESSGADAVDALLGDEETVFWIDWRQDDDSIADSCEGVLKTGALSGELVEVDTAEGFEVYVQYRDRRVCVPLSYSGADRHITICSLNQVLQPDYEVRFCIDSNGSDTLAFLPLPASTWAELEAHYGEAVGRHFYSITKSPNLFTDPLPF